MADKKISALTASSTPLAGTEVLPIVQGGSTVKVSVANLTAGRAVSASSVAVSRGAVGLVSSFSDGIAQGIVMSTGSGYFGMYNPNYGDITVRDPTNVSTFVTISNLGAVTLNQNNLVIGTANKGIDFSANANAPGMTSELLTWYEEGNWTPTFLGTVAGTLTATGTYTRVGRLVYWVANLVSTGSTSATQDVGVIQGFPFVIGSGKLGTCNIVNRSNTSTIGLGQLSISSGQTTVYTCGWTTLSNVLLSGVFEV